MRNVCELNYRRIVVVQLSSCSLFKGLSVDDYINPTKWTIKFVKPWIPFIKAPYEIAYIDYRHQNVAVISNNYAWVMSRSKTINQEYYNKILNILETSYGFNKNEFVKIIQH